MTAHISTPDMLRAIAADEAKIARMLGESGRADEADTHSDRAERLQGLAAALERITPEMIAAVGNVGGAYGETDLTPEAQREARHIVQAADILAALSGGPGR